MHGELYNRRTFLGSIAKAIQRNGIRQIKPGISQRLSDYAIHIEVHTRVICDGRFGLDGNNGTRQPVMVVVVDALQSLRRRLIIEGF